MNLIFMKNKKSKLLSMRNVIIHTQTWKHFKQSPKGFFINSCLPFLNHSPYHDSIILGCMKSYNMYDKKGTNNKAM